MVMDTNTPELFSEYIIDGVKKEMSPCELLRECMEVPSDGKPAECLTEKPVVVDERLDIPPYGRNYSQDKINEYISSAAVQEKNAEHFDLYHPESHTRKRIAFTLTETLWKEGHFSLTDLSIALKWNWDPSATGNMAAFYHSAASASQYLYDLGVTLGSYGFVRSTGKCSIEAAASLNTRKETDCTDCESSMPAEPATGKKFISDNRICPSKAIPAKDSWLIYIPFDTCQFKLGGSSFSYGNGQKGGTAPDISDPDYFIDCFEVVRELIEDGIIVSGVSAAEGGIAAAISSICSDCGINMDLSGIEYAYGEKDKVRILFSEIPGIIIQIYDTDYDYVDAQLLLQDIAYYPLGHPDQACGIEISSFNRSDVSGILAALMSGQSPEGED